MPEAGNSSSPECVHPKSCVGFMTGPGFLVSRYQSTGLAKELLGAELICSSARPKSKDEK